ncbi:endonuclease/exonuclease/phosphatase family protein [Streptomyces aureus]|uniref:Endonuclease/exonuclease/phosphatase family protein n=1 Tax=Streptomyces aureus TaxID=193461 RepID=A0ABV4SE47_9ACTN
MRATAVAVVAALAAGAVQLLSAPSRQHLEPMDRTVRVWHWNVAGNALHRGSASDGLVEAVADSVIARGADVVSLNEVCESQYTAIRRRLAARGWPQDPDNFGRFDAALAPSPRLCGGSGAYGIALFAEHGMGAARRYPLPGDGVAEPRTMLCAPRADLPRMKYCTVHIATSDTGNGGTEVARRQLDQVRSLLDGFAEAGETYVVAGDFNAQPHYVRLDPFYAASADTPNNSGNHGAHRELDDADPSHCPGYGEGTAVGSGGPSTPCAGTAKVDLILVRESQLAGAYSADALSAPASCAGMAYCSDHRVLIGEVRLRVH